LGFTDPRPTVADIVAAINAAPKNSDLLVSYGANPGGAPSTNPAGITASVPTDWVLTGEVDKTRATMRLRASENTVGPGGGVMLIGMVFPVADAGTLTLFERPAGAHADVRIGTVSGEFDGMATVTFAHWIGGLTHNTRIIASWPGDDPSLSSPSLNATAYTVVEVRSRVDCAAALVGPGDRVRLVARVSPVAAGATVWFERRVGKHWVLIRTATESKGGSAIANWVAPKGVLWLRARVAATAVNAAAWSIPGKLTVK
jgi:hypothetical protein